MGGVITPSDANYNVVGSGIEVEHVFLSWTPERRSHVTTATTLFLKSPPFRPGISDLTLQPWKRGFREFEPDRTARSGDTGVQSYSTKNVGEPIPNYQLFVRAPNFVDNVSTYRGLIGRQPVCFNGV